MSYMVAFLAHLAQMPKSLWSHELAAVCHCHWCCHCHQWTAFLATDLIIETSFLAYTCIYAPSIYT